MSRRRRRGSFVGPLIVIAIVGGAAYLLGNPAKAGFLNQIAWPKWSWDWLSSKAATSTTANAPAKPSTPAVVTRQILIGSAAPGAKSDRLFTLTLPTNEIRESNVVDGWRATELAHVDGLKIVDQKKSDGVMFLKGANDWSVPLRNAKSQPYDEAVLLGMFDETHAAVVARQDGRVLLSVSKNGEIHEAAVLSDDFNPLAAGQNAAWLSTFMPGEGIESPPRGPSNLIKIGRDGTSNSLATEPEVITLALPGPQTAYAYQTEGGRLRAVAGQTDLRRDGKPLLWLDDQTLLFAQGVTLYQWQAKDGSLAKLGDLPAAPMVAVQSN